MSLLAYFHIFFQLADFVAPGMLLGKFTCNSSNVLGYRFDVLHSGENMTTFFLLAVLMTCNSCIYAMEATVMKEKPNLLAETIAIPGEHVLRVEMVQEAPTVSSIVLVTSANNRKRS